MRSATTPHAKPAMAMPRRVWERMPIPESTTPTMALGIPRKQRIGIQLSARPTIPVTMPAMASPAPGSAGAAGIMGAYAIGATGIIGCGTPGYPGYPGYEPEGGAYWGCKGTDG